MLESLADLFQEMRSKYLAIPNTCHSRKSGNPAWIPDQVGDDIKKW